MSKLALALIVKGDDREAELLDRCLNNLCLYVDAIYITSTHKKGEKPNKAIDVICKKYKANISYFEWCNDFSKARNFNFSQVPKEYDYVMWCDADDVFRGLEKLRPLIDTNRGVDAFAFWYLYDFDKQKNPTVIHKKTQIVRNDGCVEWAGKLHEDFKENRALTVKFVEGIERLHLTTEERVQVASQRNVEVSEGDAKENPDDPRVYFNLANSYLGVSDGVNAKEAFLKFIELSASEDEKYLAYQRLASVEHILGNKNRAIELLQLAIGMKPDLPDAYHQLGFLCFEYNMLDKAEEYVLWGLAMKPKYHKMIVYNPRDYDYNPMMALAKIYFNKQRPDLSLPLLKGCLNIYPEDSYLKTLVEDMEKETERLTQVIKAITHIETLKEDKEKVLYTIEKLPIDLQSHPAICRIRNKYVVKTESSGKDIVYYCGETKHSWSPEIAKTKGIGGSEEAVINLAKEWAKQGYNVTVYNSCGIQPMEYDGVTYKPFWFYNPKDRQDITILWRTPRLADHEINTAKLFVDMHDVISEGEFNEKRLAKIDKIFVKTNAHRVLFPNVPDEKFAIIPNGQAFELFDQDVKKDPYLLVNTSSPDRSMDVLPKLFKKVKERVPQAKLKWAYGFEIYDNTFSDDKEKMSWRDQVVKEMEEAGIENLGRLSQQECAKLYLEGRILAYPSEFYEIDCISVKKAQACGCIPITTDFGAFAESNKYGVNVKSNKTIDTWCKNFQFHFGIDDEKVQDEWVEAVVKELQSPMKDTEEMKEWTKQFSWDLIANRWSNVF
jgi:glycosyltransferase involved in cell wall biosynthesis